MSLAERVRERRNQRLVAAQQRRAANERAIPLATADEVSSPPNMKENTSNNSNNPLVPVLEIDTNPPAAREWGFASISSSALQTPGSPEPLATTPHRGSRALVSPLNVPGKPPASPIQRGYAVSAPSSPRGSQPPSPGSSRPVAGGRARNLYNSIPTNSKSSNIVTPGNTSIPYLSNSSPSWEDYDGTVPSIQLPLRSDRSVSSEILPRASHNQHSSFFSSSGRNDSRSVFSEAHLADENRGHRRRSMRRSDMSADEQSVGNNSRRSIDEDDALMLRPRFRPRMPTSVRLDNSHPLLPPSSTEHNRARTGGTVLASSPSMVEDDVSSLGGVEDHLSSVSRTSLARLTAAVRYNTPKGLVAEERALWEAFQASMAASRKAALEEADPKLREKLKQQQDEEDRSFRAIQRVLADVSEDRDRANTQLKESRLEQRKLQRTMEKLEEQVEELRDSHRQAKKEAEKSKTPPPYEVPDESKAQLDDLNKKVKNLEEENEKLTTDLDSKNKQMTKLKRHLNGKGDAILSDSEELKKELEERSAALENAKMIIASLENASGSLASDTRSKLKAKDSEILSLKTDASHQQKKLDNLATQLKEVQRERAQIVEERSNETARLAIWKDSLREHLSEMQSAAVILEATREDPSAVDRFAQIIAEALETMQKTVDALDSGHSDDDDDDEIRHPSSPGSRYDGSFHGNDMDSLASGRSAASRMSKDAAVREIRQELEEKAAAVKRLEEELRRVKDEAHHSKLEAERLEQQRDTDTKTLYGEIQMLRIQCNTNMELLTKKERELAVLRDSLKVEDDDVGYISDDATDIDDEDGDEADGSNANLSMAKYSASQTEAIAALLAHGRGSVDSSSQASDVDKLRLEASQSRLEAERAQKELKMEKESLANAKMIISSLEKANKSMMEDLRSRLQESNSAIHSLLEKSMASEKTTRKLEIELEALRRENKELLLGKGARQTGEEKKEEPTETQ